MVLQEDPGGTRIPQERAQEAPGGPRRPHKAQEAPGGPVRPQEAPGIKDGPRRSQDDPAGLLYNTRLYHTALYNVIW